MTDDFEVVKEQIEKSKIKRIDWKMVFGKSLTKTIIEYKLEGLSAEQTYNIICGDERFKDYLRKIRSASQEAEDEIAKAIENLRISIYSRYAENNSALSVLKEGKS